jgi:hypothetical protein
VEMHSCSSSHDDDLRSNSDRARRPRIGRTTIFLVAAFSFVFVTSVATAATLTLGLDYEFSGGAEPVSATTPWVTITLDDSFGGPNTVRMTFEATNLTGGTTGESVNAFYLNFDSALDPPPLLTRVLLTLSWAFAWALTFAMPSAAQTPPFSVGGDPRVDPADFEITVFASGLDSPLSMQELSDGSLSVGTDGGLLRLVDADDNGVADGPGTLPYTGTGAAVHSLR